MRLVWCLRLPRSLPTWRASLALCWIVGDNWELSTATLEHAYAYGGITYVSFDPAREVTGHDLPDTARSQAGEHRPGEQAAVGGYLEAADDGSLSANTVRALKADLQRFVAWCTERDLRPFPADAATVVAYVEAVSEGRAPATVRRHVSSIAAAHKAAGERSPLEDAEVRRALRRMRRRKGSRQAQVEGLTWQLRQRLIEAAGGRMIDMRNRAMLAVAYDAMLRRSELVSLQVADVTMDRAGSASLLVRRAKTDPEGGGAVLYLHDDSVRLLGDWLGASGIREGPLFRAVRKDGTVGGALHPGQVPRIYKAMARSAGLPAAVVERLSGHSPRVGAAQDMIACGIELPAIMQAGRWRSVRMVQRYGERLLAKRNGAAQLARLQKRS